MELSQEHQEVLVRVLDFVEPLEINEWVSHILWEILHQRQQVPFWWPDGLPDDRVDDLFLLRDVVKCWFRRDIAARTWEVVSLVDWRTHFATCTTFDAILSAKAA